MAKRILSKQSIFFTHEEFAQCRRSLRTISHRAQNLERIFEAVGKRSAEEFRQAMAIIRKGGCIMQVTLTPSYELSDEHSASSYGQGVLVNRKSGEAFGPGDIIRAYPCWPFQPASQAVERMTRRLDRFGRDKRAFIQGFIRFGK